ncbi:hypothetical protein KKF34_06915 [Myxococcota bacterium]|nr:hypothetical protein [Myxococcota bacterium]MBU1381437.1 hypothetical protein [Myxococcota bacterium]MBU1496592.1 hypothetical protein [Myxococcota bacterium]
MKKNKISAFVLTAIAVLGFTTTARAKNCPSQLSANLHQVGEKELYWGFELRLANYFIWEKDATAPDSSTKMLQNGFGALRGIVDYTTSETFGGLFNFRLEAELKQRRAVDNCNAWAIPTFKDFELIPQLRNLYASFEKDEKKITIGRQNLVFGTQAILDNYFDAVNVTFKSEPLKTNFQIFAGAFAAELARETLGCGYEQYYENRRAWKRLCSSQYGDYMAAGLIARFKFLKPHQISVMNLFQWARRDSDIEELNPVYPEKLTTNFLTVHAIGPFFTQKVYYETELIGAFRPDSKKFFGGLVAGFQYRFKAGSGHFVINPRYSGTFGTDDETHFASVFESFDMGARQRYGLYDGHVYSMMVRYRIKSLRFDTGYHYHTADLLKNTVDDELEAGMTWFINNNNKYQLRLIYSVINLGAGDLPISHGFRAVARIIF